MNALLPSGVTLRMLSFYDNKQVFCYRAVLNRVLIKYKNKSLLDVLFKSKVI